LAIVSLDKASVFVDYNEGSRTFSIAAGATDSTFIGTYSITIILTDAKGTATEGTLSLKVIEGIEV